MECLFIIIIEKEVKDIQPFFMKGNEGVRFSNHYPITK